MSLSSEDALRINVLLANKPLAIRIHDSTMTLFGLSDQGETKIKLNPNCRDDQYIRHVKEMLSGHILGSPGGYPVYLQRWTRMGQMREDNLDQLLLLGEPEAVIAVVCAQGLSNALAERAWWAMDDAENARRMLCRETVCKGSMGPKLAAYLIEHLPFETEAEQMMDTIALVLQEGLVDASVKEDLWKKAKRKNAFYVGFLQSCSTDLPDQPPPSLLFTKSAPLLESLEDNKEAALLLKVLSPSGQAFLQTLEMVLKKPANQEVVTRLLDIIAAYFEAMRPQGGVDQSLEELESEAHEYVAQTFPDFIGQLEEVDGKMVEKLVAMRILSGMSYAVIRPMLRDSTAIGSLMRRKLEPVVVPILGHICTLRDEA